jgi:hypothetical protein
MRVSTAPAINASGQVAFWGSTTTGASGIFRYSNGSTNALLSGYYDLNAGGTFSSFGQAPAIDAAGDVAFKANISGSGLGVTSGIYVATNGHFPAPIEWAGGGWRYTRPWTARS